MNKLDKRLVENYCLLMEMLFHKEVMRVGGEKLEIFDEYVKKEYFEGFDVIYNNDFLLMLLYKPWGDVVGIFCGRAKFQEGDEIKEIIVNKPKVFAANKVFFNGEVIKIVKEKIEERMEDEMRVLEKLPCNFYLFLHSVYRLYVYSMLKGYDISDTPEWMSSFCLFDFEKILLIDNNKKRALDFYERNEELFKECRKKKKYFHQKLMELGAKKDEFERIDNYILYKGEKEKIEFEISERGNVCFFTKDRVFIGGVDGKYVLKKSFFNKNEKEPK
jgi:hypothetical protein